MTIQKIRTKDSQVNVYEIKTGFCNNFAYEWTYVLRWENNTLHGFFICSYRSFKYTL